MFPVTGVHARYAAGHKDPLELRTVDFHKTGLETKKLIVQQALNTEDMDQERFLSKVRQRFDRYAAGLSNSASACQDSAPAYSCPLATPAHLHYSQLCFCQAFARL